MSPRSWLAFAGVSLLWGIPYFLIKVAVAEVSPADVAWARLFLGAAILLPIAWRRGALSATWARLPWVAFIGVAYMALPWLLIPVGETTISSSLAAIIIAAVPLTVTVISLREERPHSVRLVGLVAGLAGVALMVGVDAGGRPSELFGIACLVATTVCYAVGPIVISRKLSDLDRLGPVALALATGTVVETVPAALTLPHRLPSVGTLLALLVLGILCTAVAMALFFFLVGDAGPGRATLVTYVNPLVAVLLGVAILGERFGISTGIGGALVLAGSWLATRRPRPASAANARGPAQSSPPPAAASTTPWTVEPDD